MQRTPEESAAMEKASSEIFAITEKFENKRAIISLLIIQMAHTLMSNYRKEGHAEILLRFSNEVLEHIDKAEQAIAALSEEEIAAISAGFDSKGAGHA